MKQVQHIHEHFSQVTLVLKCLITFGISYGLCLDTAANTHTSRLGVYDFGV